MKLLQFVFFCFSWRMLLEFSSTFEFSSLTFRKRKLKKGKRSCPGESDWQNSEIIWSINFQNNDGHADTDLGPSPSSTTARFYVKNHSQQPLTTVAKNSILDVVKDPRFLSDIYDILISYILISYFIYLEKSKSIVPFIHSSHDTITIKIKNIPFRFNCTIARRECNQLRFSNFQECLYSKFQFLDSVNSSFYLCLNDKIVA